jgi:hypothetical protein
MARVCPSVLAAPLTAALIALGVQSISADVKTDERGHVKFEGGLGRVVSIFGGKAAREGVKSTLAVKGDRKITTNDVSGQIIDLAEEKIYELDVRKKTYTVTTFEELRRRMEDARKRAEADAANTQEKPAEPPPDSNAKEMEVDFAVKDTGQRRTINGFDTRQAIMTIAFREKGRTLEQAGGLVVTSDIWLAPRIAAMQEVADFELRYAKALHGPMIAGASPEEMAAALALYPMLRDGLARMRDEAVKLDGTAILTTTTVESVKSEEQLAAEKKSAEAEGRPSVSGGIGGLVGGLARRAAQRNEPPKARATFMTITNEVLKVTTDVSATDVGIPAGFREAR